MASKIINREPVEKVKKKSPYTKSGKRRKKAILSPDNPRMKNLEKRKPFQKGFDPRRNLKGRPRTSDALREAVLDLLNDKEGGKSRLENMLLDMIKGKNILGRIEVLNRGYGKISDEVVFRTDDIQKIIDFLPDAYTERLAKGEPLGEVLIAYITSNRNDG